MKEKEEKRVPQLRFPEFTDDWEQRKLYEMCGTFEYGLNAAAKEFDGKNKYIRITDIDDASREFLLSDLSSPDICLDGMSKYLLSRGDIVFARTGASVGKTYIYKENDGVVYFAGFLIRTKVNQGNDAEFVFQSTLSPGYEKYIHITSQRSGQPGVNAQEYGEYELFAPSKEEQQRIGQFLRGIDNLITLHQRKLEKLKELRKGVMKKLFSQEVRFKADDGSEFPDWEEKKLGDDVQFINGRAYKQDELLNSGKYLVLRVGNLFTNDSYYYSDLELDNDKYIENGDLIYAWSATFGPRIYYGEKCIYHYHIWKLKFDENIISKIFLNYYLLYDVEKIKSQRTGGTMVHITKNAMEHRELQFPCLAEQQKIADCLSILDLSLIHI